MASPLVDYQSIFASSCSGDCQQGIQAVASHGFLREEVEAMSSLPKPQFDKTL